MQLAAFAEPADHPPAEQRRGQIAPGCSNPITASSYRAAAVDWNSVVNEDCALMMAQAAKLTNRLIFGWRQLRTVFRAPSHSPISTQRCTMAAAALSARIVSGYLVVCHRRERVNRVLRGISCYMMHVDVEVHYITQLWYVTPH